MNLSTVTLAQLAYLVAIDRHRSFREAADACHVSQPALSQQVRKVEEALGVQVFDRSRQPVVPTDLGRRVLAQARVVLREAARVGDVVREASGEPAGPYRLGILPTLAPTLLPRFLPRFLRRHPRVELSIEELQTEAMIARLADDTLDGGVAATPLGAPGIREVPLYREPFQAYVAAGHRLARRRRIAQADLARESVWLLGEGHCFRNQVLQLCASERRVVAAGGGSVRLESGSFETLVGLVDADMGLTVLPELAVRDLPPERRRRHVRPFAPPVPTREVGFVHARSQLRRGVAEALHAAIRAAVPAELVQAAARDRGRLLPPVAAPGDAAPAVVLPRRFP